MHCPNCGQTIKDETKFCWKCGTDIEKARGDANVSYPPLSTPEQGFKQGQSSSLVCPSCRLADSIRSVPSVHQESISSGKVGEEYHSTQTHLGISLRPPSDPWTPVSISVIALLIIIGVFCNGLFTFGSKGIDGLVTFLLYIVLPVIVIFVFFGAGGFAWGWLLHRVGIIKDNPFEQTRVQVNQILFRLTPRSKFQLAKNSWQEGFYCYRCHRVFDPRTGNVSVRGEFSDFWWL